MVHSAPLAFDQNLTVIDYAHRLNIQMHRKIRKFMLTDSLPKIEPLDAWIPQIPIYRGDAHAPAQRIAQRKRDILATPRKVFLDTARIETASYKQTEGEPVILRRAHAFRAQCRKLPIQIYENELIVGNRSLLPRMGVIMPSAAVHWIDRELDTLETRPQDPFHISPEEIAELRRDIFPYWQGKTLEDAWAQNVPDDVRAAIQAKAFKINQTDHAQGHILPDVEAWLALGPLGLKEKVLEARARQTDLSDAQREFYHATLTCLDGAMEFMARYAELAQQLAQRERSETRRAELERIAENCQHLASNPPDDFWQALQAVAFLFVLLEIESNASSFSPGRLDQYLYPYLERDAERGALDLETAQELLESLWCKFNEIILLRSAEGARYFAGFPIGFNIAIGGQRADGTDATNVLSYMCLQAQADLQLPQPNLSARLHRHSPQEFLNAVARTIAKGGGMPQVFNDAVIVPAYEKRGVTHADALNYAIVGCVELSIPGKALGWSDASMFNLVRVLEFTLHGGRVPETGEQIGPATKPLTEMQSFDALQDAYATQLAHFIALMVQGCNVIDQLHPRLNPTPFLSTVIDDCIARGLDVTAGGAHYNFSGVQGVQIANVADSLAALKTLVFEQKRIRANDLMNALQKDFEDNEILRQRLLNNAPKYGNDDDAVDDLARQWARFFCDEVAKYPTPRGGTFHPGFYTVSAHVPLGKNVGATPDGRFAHAPLADGGMSPTAGRDIKGPTAVLRSVGKVDQTLVSNGALLNLKFLPSFFEQDNALDWFTAFLRAFVELGVCHMQFNVISGDTLRAAQAHPEEYRGLVVRVAGYSAYFVELAREVQDEIIRRTEHGG